MTVELARQRMCPLPGFYVNSEAMTIRIIKHEAVPKCGRSGRVNLLKS
jgi:hypothetical protein